MTRNSYIQLGVAFVILATAVGALIAATIITNQERERAESLISDIATKRLESMRVAAAKEALPALAADELAITQYFVKADDIVPFLEKLQKTGATQKTVVEVLSVSGDPAKSNTRISISLKITGSFDAVMRTLGTIEYSPYDIALTNVTLESDRTPSQTGGVVWTAAAIFTVGTQPGESAAKK